MAMLSTAEILYTNFGKLNWIKEVKKLPLPQLIIKQIVKQQFID